MKTILRQKSANLSSLRNILLLGFIMALFCGMTYYVILLKSCLFLNCVEERSFNVLDLDLPADLFPDQAIINPMLRPSTSEGAFDSGSKTVYWRAGNGIATYKVWRFRKEREASQAYIAESGGTIYIANKELLYQSSIADEFSTGCGRLQNFEFRCKMTARYQEYTVNFNSIIDDEMSIEMFNEVITFIDQEMERHLYVKEGE